MPNIYDIARRAATLCDYDIKTVRRILAGFDCDEMPSDREAKQTTSHLTKGQMVQEILCHEFEDPE